MKYILTDKDNVINYIANNIQEKEDRYLLVEERMEILKDYPEEDTQGHITHNYITLYRVVVPDGIEVEKYCYTPNDGFYENPDYVEPPKPIEERVDILETNSTEYELALAEIYEELINRG